MGLVSKIYRKKDYDKLFNKIKMMGKDYNYSADKFIFLRLISSLIVFLIVLLIFDFGYFFAPLLTIFYYYLFEFIFLDLPLKAKVRKLDYEALYFFEILTLTLESGRNLKKALEIAVDNVDSDISKEFKRTLDETKCGKTLMEALDDMKKRIPSETINNIILNITQTSIFGNSIIDTMYNQIDFLRDKQILDIKGQINKIPNKVSIISVLFVIPLILLLVLGPFLISFI